MEIVHEIKFFLSKFTTAYWDKSFKENSVCSGPKPFPSKMPPNTIWHSILKRHMYTLQFFIDKIHPLCIVEIINKSLFNDFGRICGR